MNAFVRIAVLISLAGVALGACGGEEEAVGQAAPAAVPVAAEDAVRAARRTIRVGPRIAGSLDARKRADVRAEAGGQVLEVSAELGQQVKKGQVLARIEAAAQGDALRSARAAVRSARENLTVAKRQAERTARAGRGRRAGRARSGVGAQRGGRRRGLAGPGAWPSRPARAPSWATPPSGRPWTARSARPRSTPATWWRRARRCSPSSTHRACGSRRRCRRRTWPRSGWARR